MEMRSVGSQQNASTGEKTVFRVKWQYSGFLQHILLTCVIVVFAYVLSMGPAYRLLRKHRITQPAFRAAYYPVKVVSEINPFLERLLSRYLDMWYSDAREISKALEEIRNESTNAALKSNP